MFAITYAEAREKLAATMKRVSRNREAIIITRERSGAVVMMSLQEYAALTETAYLLRSPRNARRLRSAIRELEHGRSTRRKLLE